MLFNGLALFIRDSIGSASASVSSFVLYRACLWLSAAFIPRIVEWPCVILDGWMFFLNLSGFASSSSSSSTVMLHSWDLNNTGKKKQHNSTKQHDAGIINNSVIAYWTREWDGQWAHPEQSFSSSFGSKTVWSLLLPLWPSEILWMFFCCCCVFCLFVYDVVLEEVCVLFECKMLAETSWQFTFSVCWNWSIIRKRASSVSTSSRNVWI